MGQFMVSLLYAKVGFAVCDKRETNPFRRPLKQTLSVCLDNDGVRHRVLVVMERSLFLNRPLRRLQDRRFGGLNDRCAIHKFLYPAECVSSRTATQRDLVVHVVQMR